jgi:four helix bundle protein
VGNNNQIPSTKIQTISNNSNSKLYDLEERTKKFAKNCRTFVSSLPKSTANIEDGKQLIRSSGSVAANYIEANESLSKKDFLLRAKICRKEAKESKLWLDLIETSDVSRKTLLKEATELVKIFSAIIQKSL